MKWVITSQILKLIPITLSCFFNCLPKGRKAPTVKKSNMIQSYQQRGVHSVYREHVRACYTILDNDLYPSTVSQQVQVHMYTGQRWNVLTSHNSSAAHTAVLTNQQISLVSFSKSVKKKFGQSLWSTAPQSCSALFLFIDSPPQSWGEVIQSEQWLYLQSILWTHPCMIGHGF